MMNKTQTKVRESTAVDDVRLVREKIAARHKGNIHQHMEETNRIFEQLRTKLKLKPVPPPKRRSLRSGS
jgi:hypothetical protein